MGTQLTYRFGPYAVDVNRRAVSCGPNVTSLSEKLFQILLLLLEADGSVVSKDEFFDRVWPSEGASDANLTQHIFMLRSILSRDEGEHSYILTVSGKGYRLGVPVEKKTGLNMKSRCERCGAHLASDQAAYICSYECTYCARCANELEQCCKNCRGELVPRPRRTGAPDLQRADQLSKWFR